MRAGIRARPWVGLDIGSYSVKLIALQGGVGGVRHWIAESPLPAPSRGDALTAEELARAIQDCIQLAGLQVRGLRGLTTAVSGGDVVIKQISLPLLDDAEIAGALRFEARKHIPFDLSSMVIDYQLLGRFPSEKRLDVLLAAVPAQRLERAMQPLRLLGLDADIVDAAPLALANALARGAERDGESRLLLDFGHAGSWLTLFQKGSPFFSRYLDYGGADMTAAVARALDIPLEEAEEWKLAAGSEDPTVRTSWDGLEFRALHESLRTQLAEDIRRSLAFYRTMAPLPDPLTLWISGGPSRLSGFTAELSQLLEIPALLFDPLDQLDPQHREATPPGGPQFAQAYGLALRSA